MVIRGLNSRINVLRVTQGADDTIGGTTESEATVLSNVRCRIDNPNRGDVGRIEHMEGVDFLRLIKLTTWPAVTDVRAGDIIKPVAGPFASDRFIVLDIKQDSITQSFNSAHTEIVAERYDSGRSKQ